MCTCVCVCGWAGEWMHFEKHVWSYMPMTERKREQQSVAEAIKGWKRPWAANTHNLPLILPRKHMGKQTVKKCRTFTPNFRSRSGTLTRWMFHSEPPLCQTDSSGVRWTRRRRQRGRNMESLCSDKLDITDYHHFDRWWDDQYYHLKAGLWFKSQLWAFYVLPGHACVFSLSLSGPPVIQNSIQLVWEFPFRVNIFIYSHCSGSG